MESLELTDCARGALRRIHHRGLKLPQDCFRRAPWTTRCGIGGPYVGLNMIWSLGFVEGSIVGNMLCY